MSIQTENSTIKLPNVEEAHSKRKNFNPSLTNAAKNRLSASRISKSNIILREKARREAEQAEARALGVRVVEKIRVDRTWTCEEDEVVRALYPDYKGMRSKLPHRSSDSIKHRADKLGLLQKRLGSWSASELTKLKKIYPTSDMSYLLTVFKDKTAKQIRGRASASRLRKEKSYIKTGNNLLDSIRQRCIDLNYDMSDLDAMASTGSYFRESRWKTREGFNQMKLALAVKALGGKLLVEWSSLD